MNYSTEMLNLNLNIFSSSFSRQVQRLCDFKGAECEEYDHHSPWGPAMLGTRLHVVSRKSSKLCDLLLSLGNFIDDPVNLVL